MNDEAFKRDVEKLRASMLLAGDFKLGSLAIKDADPRLLLPEDDDIHEHWRTYQAAVAYYGRLLNDAEQRKNNAEEELRKAVLREQKSLYQKARDSYGLSRPGREDLILIAVIEGNADLARLHEEVNYWTEAVADLKCWVTSWDKKSFVLNGVLSTVVDSNRTAVRASPPRGDPESRFVKRTAI